MKLLEAVAGPAILNEVIRLNGVREMNRADISSILKLMEIGKKLIPNELYYSVRQVNSEKLGFIRVNQRQRMLQFEVPPTCPREVFLDDAVALIIPCTSRKRKRENLP